MPLKEPSLGIQLPKRQSQSIGELTVCIVTPLLPVKEASLIEVCSMSSRYSTEPDSSALCQGPLHSALLLMKLTPAMERESL